jgi:hypothetical protein
MAPPPTPPAKGGSAKGISGFLATTRGKAIAGGTAAVLAVALYERQKNSAATAAAAAAAGQPATTASVQGQAPTAYGYEPGDIADLESQLQALGAQIQQQQATSTTSTGSTSGSTPTAQAPGGVPLATTADKSIPPSQHLNAPVVDAIPTHGGQGMYYLTSDGGVFDEGGLPGTSLGSAVGKDPGHKFVRIIGTSDGGYALVDDAGKEFLFPAKAAAAS